jgi:transcriptional regulator with XRE-family HTH domain
MTAIAINDSSRPSGKQSHTRQPGGDKEIVTVITYAKLIEYHLKRRALNKDGNQRPEQALDNERSVITSWLTKHKLSPSDSVGEELGVSFNERLTKYCLDNEHSGLAKQTVSDRKTILTKLHESFLELRRTDGLPKDFCGALKELVKDAGTSLWQLARKAGISPRALKQWISGTYIPRPKSLTHIRKLEKGFKVSPGTLSSRLPGAHWSKQVRRRCTTTWREHQRLLLRLKYRLPALTGLPREEWGELVQFYTDPQWASERGLETNSEWRIRWNTNRCHTAEINLGFVRGFFGFLCLPETATDERVAGMGFDPQNLTLALLTDADLIRKFLNFMKGRSVSGSYNSATLRVLSLSTMLTRNETGYLRQRPEFGTKLPQPVAETDWPSWCERNRLKMLGFKEEITNGKKSKKNKNGQKDRVRMTRDPFEPVIDIITERQHPITALFDLADKLESLTPLMEKRSKHALAVHSRSIFHVRLIGSNPLRGENFSMMTYIPQDQGAFEKACKRYREEKQTPDFSELYVETTKDSNLYQKPDGSWRLRFNERDFKNEKGEDLEPGVRNAPYDVPVVPSVWPALTEYIFRQRPVLNEYLVGALKKVRAKRGLPPLMPEEELAVMRCRYVFRPGTQGINHIGTEQLLAGHSTGQMSVESLSGHILSLTSRYLPESKGFSAHACRHLVATEYIKNEPNGWDVAAEALHNTPEMVRKHYSWVVVGDRIKPWNDHHERLKGMHDRGEI